MNVCNDNQTVYCKTKCEITARSVQFCFFICDENRNAIDRDGEVYNVALVKGGFMWKPTMIKADESSSYKRFR